MTQLSALLVGEDVKRPAMLFYCGDHLRDIALSACSLAAQGLWWRMQCVMHDCRPYGVLSLRGKDIPPPVLARMVGANPEETAVLLSELESAGVFSRNADGLIYSRRMVRDELIRSKRAAGGVESLKHPKVPRPKTPSSKDPQQGHPPTGPRGGSLQGSPSIAVSVSVPSSPSETGSSSSTGDEVDVRMELGAAAAAAEAYGFKGDLPADLQQRFAALAISDAMAQQLAHQVGGWEEVRFAVDRLSEKQANGEVHNASGLLVARVRELAEEGRGLSESRFRGLELEFPEAFRDSRWLRLNLVCRQNISVASAWGTWWKAHGQLKACPMNQDAALLQEERRAWKKVLECAIERHPDRAVIQQRVDAALQQIPRKSESDLVYLRASIHRLGKELGLAETSDSEVAS